MAVLDLDAKRGLFACYTGMQDEAPLTSPLTNLSRVKWHASLPYLGAGPKTTRVVNFNWRTWTATPNTHIKLVTHGKSFRPLVLGTVWLQGKPVPAHASFMVPFPGLSGSIALEILSVSLYSDATHVCLGLNSLTQLFFPEANVSNVTPIETATLEFYVCNMGVTASGAPVLPPSIAYFEATPDRMRCGQFDTNDQHFARNDAAGDVVFHNRSPSIRADLIGGAAGNLRVSQNTAGYGFIAGGNIARNDAAAVAELIPAASIIRTSAK